MADRINFSKKINDSVQVGDELWYSNVIAGSLGSPLLSGTINNIGDKWVKVDNAPLTAGSGDFITNGGFDPDFDTSIITNGDFATDAVNWNDGILGNPLPTGITWNNGGIDFDLTSASWTKLNQYITSAMVSAVAGDQYLVRFDITNYSQGQLIGRLSGPSDSVLFPVDATTSSHASINGNGNYEYLVTLGDSSFGHANRFYLGLDNTSTGFVGSVDNISVQKNLATTANWDPGTNWVFNNDGTFEHTTGTAGYLDQNLTTSLIEGEIYRITFDVVGGTTGNILLANHAPGGDNVTIVIDSGNVTYTQDWVQGANNTNKIRIYQDSSGDRIIDNVSVIDPSTAQELFFMFRKPVEQNVSSLKGYYAESTFTNNSTEKQELFSVGSEVTMSSK